MNEVLEQLLDKYLTDSLSTVEQAALREMISSEAFEGETREYIDRYMEENRGSVQYAKLRGESFERLRLEIQAQRRVVQMRWVKRLAVAAMFILVAGTGWYLMSRSKQQGIAVRPTKDGDIAAGKTGAVLRLDDGTTIVLDTAKVGKVRQGIEKGQESVTVADEVVQYATLTTPRARQQQLVLADGSKVWLNAGSSIRFPTAFTGKERRVEITGEAYFEVAKNKEKPFIVAINKVNEVEVLGTHFNVMAYENEPGLQTTLLEGSVRFLNANGSVILKPGEQSVATQGKVVINKDPDIEQVMAWKNGLQVFHSANIQSIMRQVERWYDVDVVYETKIPEGITFTGEGISRNVSLAELLKVFENNKVKFEIDEKERKVIVR